MRKVTSKQKIYIPGATKCPNQPIIPTFWKTVIWSSQSKQTKRIQLIALRGISVGIGIVISTVWNLRTVSLYMSVWQVHAVLHYSYTFTIVKPCRLIRSYPCTQGRLPGNSPGDWANLPYASKKKYIGCVFICINLNIFERVCLRVPGKSCLRQLHTQPHSVSILGGRLCHTWFCAGKNSQLLFLLLLLLIHRSCRDCIRSKGKENKT